MNAVQEAIAKAQANAQELVPATANTNALPAMQGQKPSLASFAQTSSADVWLKVKEGGLQLGDDPKFHESLTFRVNFADIDVYFSASGGNPPKYERSRDRILSETGKAWSLTLEDLSKYAGRAVRDYLSATIPFEVVDTIAGKTGKTEAGVIVGYSLPYTSAQEFGKLQKRMIKENLDLEGTYLVTVEALPQKNAQGNNYAKLIFTDIKPDTGE